MASLVPLDGSMPVAEELGRQVLATGGRMTSDEVRPSLPPVVPVT